MTAQSDYFVLEVLYFRQVLFYYSIIFWTHGCTKKSARCKTSVLFSWRIFGCSGVPHDQQVSVALLLALFCPHIPCPGRPALRSCLSGQTMTATYRIFCGLRKPWCWTLFSNFYLQLYHYCSMDGGLLKQVTLSGLICTRTHGCIKNAARCMTSVFFVAYVWS